MSTQAVPTSLPTPLADDKRTLLLRLVDDLDAGALQWVSGYAAGLAAARRRDEPRPVAAPLRQPVPRVTVVHGTQTGNSHRLAERLRERVGALGLEARNVRACDYPARELKSEKLVHFVVSTQGDGDPPDDARALFDFLMSPRAPRLEQLSYSVLALGDSSYAKYCEAGRVLDERLAQLGATRLAPRTDCDVDFEDVAAPWIERASSSAREILGLAPIALAVAPAVAASEAPTASREAPFVAEVLVNQRITGRGASKDVRHVELSLEGSGLTYAPGDSLGVLPVNPPALVDAILAELHLDGAAEVTREERDLPLSRWLSEEMEITRLGRPFLARHAALSGGAALAEVLDASRREALAAMLRDWQLIDVLRAHPAPWTAEELVLALRRISPRLYSIASSAAQVGEEAHLTVAVVDYEALGERHVGAASDFLATRAPGETVRVFLERNDRFRLPDDSSRDVIMIGPGTGVAPFRAFVQERAETGASGRNWLFFGERHFTSTFLYQTEWQAALRDGSLNRLDLAFSRDQDERIHVQQRLRERGADVFAWLQAGAHVYVCGDARAMAADVHAALVDVVATHGGRSREDAESYLAALRDEKRYQRDVY
jgi:sulfite reductase (NADPH) flavoprotein alpha-component